MTHDTTEHRVKGNGNKKQIWINALTMTHKSSLEFDGFFFVLFQSSFIGFFVVICLFFVVVVPCARCSTLWNVMHYIRASKLYQFGNNFLIFHSLWIDRMILVLLPRLLLLVLRSPVENVQVSILYIGSLGRCTNRY